MASEKQTSISLRPFSLAFRSREDEESFRSEHLHKSLLQMRFAAVLGCMFYNVFIFIDAYLFPDEKWTLWLMRFGTIPFLLGFVPLSYLPRLKKYMQTYIATLAVGVGILVALMMLVVSDPLIYRYSMGILLTLIFIHTIIQVPFVMAAVSSWVLVLFYEVTVGIFTDIPRDIFIIDSFFVISFNLAGMVARYSTEYYQRREFYLGRQVKKLEGLLPICASCKQIRMEGKDPQKSSSWVELEEYIAKKTDADFTHSICPVCEEKLYGDYLRSVHPT